MGLVCPLAVLLLQCRSSLCLHPENVFSLWCFYGCTVWKLTQQMEKKLDGNYTRMLRAIFNKSWRHHSKNHQLCGHQPPVTKIIKVRRTRHAGHCWRIRDELISDILQWSPSYGRAKAGRTARTYIQQLCEDTGCSPEDLPEVMNDREEWGDCQGYPCWRHDMMMRGRCFFIAISERNTWIY